MTLPKPERVEVGQWWAAADRLPIEIDDPFGWEWLLTEGTYLGSGDHPAPSDWMIETLLAHAQEVAPKAADDYDSATIRHILSGGTTASYDPREGLAMNRSVLSLHKILRSLGKW